MPFPFRIHSPITAAVAAAMLTPGASVAAPSTAPITKATPDSPAMCGNERMPRIPITTTSGAPATPARFYKIACALDHGVLVGSPEDQGENIRSALAALAPKETGLFFPQGRYIVGGKIELQTGNVLVGSRVGVSEFINQAQTTSAITQAIHSANDILVDGLMLENISVFFFHSGGNIIRQNVFRKTRSRLAQITVLGADRVEGNVLWREAENPGAGILAAKYSPAKGENAKGENAQIHGNVLGVDPRAALGQKDSIADLAMWRSIGGTNLPPVQDVGHFTVALSALGTRGTHISKNVLMLNPTAAGVEDLTSLSTSRLHLQNGAEGWRQAAAYLGDVDGLSFTGNRVTFTGDAATPGLLIAIRAPQDTTIANNDLIKVSLTLTADPQGKRATKRTVVAGNLLVDGTIDISQAVTGDSEDWTTIHDLRFTLNFFRTSDATQCLISAPIPSPSDRTFEALRNVRVPAYRPAKTCYLRGKTPQQRAEQRPLTPVRSPDVKAPVIPPSPAVKAAKAGGGISTTVRVTDVKTPIVPKRPAAKPSAASGVPATTEVPAQKPSQKNWFVRLFERILKWLF